MRILVRAFPCFYTLDLLPNSTESLLTFSSLLTCASQLRAQTHPSRLSPPGHCRHPQPIREPGADQGMQHLQHPYRRNCGYGY